MENIETKIKPLYRDLKEIRIGEYLKSVDFDRYTISVGLDKIWNSALKEQNRGNNVVWLGLDTTSYEKEEALGILLNSVIKSSQSDFNYIISKVLTGFIQWNTTKIDLENIFTDLELSDLPLSLIAELREIHEIRSETISSQIETKKEKVNDKADKKDLIESKRNDWINLVSKGKIDNALENIKKYTIDTNDLALIKPIVNLSSRWNRVNDDFRSGIIKNEEKELEINKINDSLLDLIMKVK